MKKIVTLSESDYDHILEEAKIAKKELSEEFSKSKESVIKHVNKIIGILKRKD